MLKRTERQVFCYDIRVAARAKHAAPPQMRAIVEALKLMFDKGDCAHEREHGAVIYRLGDIRIANTNTAHLMIRRCDTNAANAVYSHRGTGKSRVAAKDTDEGGDRAAHLVISLTAETNKPDTYLCHLEGVAGLSHRLVQATLNAILREAAREDENLFVYPNASGARDRTNTLKMHTFIPNIELLGHTSGDLISDLNNGKIDQITLVKQKPKSPIGGSQYLFESEYRLKLEVSKQIPTDNRIQNIMSALKTKERDFQTAKIRFRDQSGRPRSIDYDIAVGSPEQQNYIATYTVSNISPPMDESSVELAPFLTTAIEKRVVADRK